MPIHVSLQHKTHYTYDRAVVHGPHVVRLRPAPHCRTRILSYSQKIVGGEAFLNWQQDPFANWNARLVFPEPMKELCVEVQLIAEMAVHNPFDFFLEEAATYCPFTYDPSLQKDLRPFLDTLPSTPLLSSLVATCRKDMTSVDSKPVRTIDFLVKINQRLQQAIRYVIRLEPGVQAPEETLTKASGSCRDSAWLLVQALRHLGLAARFASGYLIQLRPDIKPLDGAAGAEADFTDLHAWCEVYLPGAGWIGLDPTSGLLAGEGHIPLSCTPEPSTAAPVSGAVDPCESKLHHEMSVTRVHESPRVTLPYSEEEWSRIQTLGHHIDKDLTRRDVRLTMGGEPTFVSIDDPDGPEWNFTAVSPKKRALGGQLLRRLRQKFAPGSILHHGQGKWYPGEPLPRWTLAAYWRRDGLPLWKDETLIADESTDYGFGTTEARALAQAIAGKLGVEDRWLMTGYEDVFYYTWKERRLPSNVTPTASHLEDPLERERLARLFQKGIGKPVGYALPVSKDSDGSLWVSGPWFLRDGEILWLTPGDSPMGLRLPLGSIPWVAEKDHPWMWPADPTQPLSPLPGSAPSQRRILPPGRTSPAVRREEGPRGRDKATYPSTTEPQVGESAPWIIRTALCVEPREGRLYVFLPPVESTEDYLALIECVEAAAAEMRLPVVLEGETPPKDPRLNSLAITPDPGVIEVNLHPSASWDELVERTTVLYEEARQTRLGTEKFMLDGRHTGTGGGNHIVLGGATPLDSPLLRRPDLLRSLLAYWQNHPSLSRVFSGMFIGPTSQAPRVDEARNDSLYELDIAFRELDRKLETPAGLAPWLADRLFRNLLIDASGNTHRAEFSIDKLYAPEGSGSRLGLVEMRAFEMPPHARMSLAQQLLIRGLISRFWNQPYKADLIRWGTDIHDRWLLPHYCERDFEGVLSDLRDAGYDFESSWFAPHFEFRFPRIGDWVQRDVQLELRAALEPWHVLGEEGGPGGTVRNVDSSLERLQVKVSGMMGQRFQITCNGRRLPLHPTGVNGESVAGVRYRAWQPPECLQPTIPVQAPLVFDLYDTWNRRSLGGCTYHVAHPGGLSHSQFPVNAYEAEARRLARFQTHGGLQRPFIPPPETLNPELPYTLDLRR